MSFRSFLRSPTRRLFWGQSINPTARLAAQDGNQGFNSQELLDSIGIRYRSMGSAECWEASGVVRETFLSLSLEINNHLKDWGELGDPNVTWSIFMIGETKETAVPTLLFCCKKRELRISAKTQIMESGMLRRYPGIRVGDCSESPDVGRVIPLSGGAETKNNRPCKLEGERESTILGESDYDLLDKSVFIRPTDQLSGSRIFGADMRTASAGAAFRLHGKPFVTTIGHAFSSQSQSSRNDSDLDDLFEFEIPGVAPPLPGSIGGDAAARKTSDPSRPSIPECPVAEEETVKLGSLVFSANDAAESGLDFNLIEIDESNSTEAQKSIYEHLPDYNTFRLRVAQEPIDRAVKVTTPSNAVMNGRLSGTPAFIRSSGGVGFREVWAVRFDGQLNQGDCGSMVTGLNNDVIYGHIMAGNLASGAAYIVPAPHIFKALDECIVPHYDSVSMKYDNDSSINLQNDRGFFRAALCPEKAENTFSPSDFAEKRLPTWAWARRRLDWDWDEVGDSPFLKSGSLNESEVIEAYCEGYTLNNVKSGTGFPGRRKTAWLDDRGSQEITSTRWNSNPLTTTELYRALSQPRIHSENQHDRDRRLIYITDLNPSHILALAATAPVFLEEGVRDAIYKHITFDASVKFKAPFIGLGSFQLDFHLPYYAWRSSAPPKQRGSKPATPPRQWSDLSFLVPKKLPPDESPLENSSEVFGTQECHFSIYIAGADKYRWWSYCFTDSHTDEDLMDILVEDDESFSPDPVANGVLNSNLPIWDPREYFLAVCKIRLKQVCGEWDYLIRKVELGIKTYLDDNDSDSAAKFKRDFDWVQRTMNLLSKLDNCLEKTVDAWEKFETIDFGKDGAKLSASAHQKLCAIKESGEDLLIFKKKVNRQLRICQRVAQDLQLQLTLAGTASGENIGRHTELGVILFFPLSMTMAFFTMPNSVVPFPLSTNYLLLTFFLFVGMVMIILKLMVRAHRLPPWSLLKYTIASWISRKKAEESYEPLNTGTLYEKAPMIEAYHHWTESERRS